MSAMKACSPLITRAGTFTRTLVCAKASIGSSLPWKRRFHQAAAAAAVWDRASLLERQRCWRGTGLSHHKALRPAHVAMQIRAASAGDAVQIKEMDVGQLREVLKGVDQDDITAVQLIDVREEFEHEIASLPGFQLLPLSRFQEWGPIVKETLDPEKEAIVLCHHGVRSMRASAFLASQGFQKVSNVTGGIDAYSRQVDSSVPLYE